MGLGTNRDYRTQDRWARLSLAWHANRTEELTRKGVERAEASRLAFEEWVAIPLAEKSRLFREQTKADNAKRQERIARWKK